MQAAVPDPQVHPAATVETGAILGPGVQVWHGAHIRAGAVIGAHSSIGKDAYIDADVVIGPNCKVQNGAQLFRGATLAAGIFIGPGAILTNDRYPRAINPDGTLKGPADWRCGRIAIEAGAAIGAGAIILPDLRIGTFALVGAGAVVTHDVPPHALVIGNPARIVGRVCRCGLPLAARRPCATCGDALETLHP